MWDISVIEDLIYNAVAHSESWPKILEEIAKIAKAKAVTLTLKSKVISEWLISEQYKSFLQKTIDAGTSIEPNGRLKSRTSKRDDQFTGFHITDVSGFHGEQIEIGSQDSYNLASVITTKIKSSSGEVYQLNIYRTSMVSPSDNALLDELRRIRPHLVRSISLSAQLEFEKAAGVISFVNSIGYAAFALSKDGKIVLENQKSLYDKNFWRNRNGLPLSSIESRSESVLNDELYVLNNDNGAKSFPLFSEKNDEIGLLTILPFTQYIFTEISFIGIISKSKNISENIEALLQIFFNLTKAEAIISIKFIEGKTANEIAAETDKSVHTIRNQINSILQKTGCRRQSDLSYMFARLTNGAL